MRNVLVRAILIGASLVLIGCATYHRRGLPGPEAQQVEQRVGLATITLSTNLQQKILALDAEHVTGQQVREILSHAPAPRIINIHGGIYPVHIRMISFSRFLLGMGYPQMSVTNPGDGTYTFSCYESAEKIAGMIAWFYEKEGLRPMMFGHSQGGFQVVKILDLYAAGPDKKIPVWNAVTWKKEPRCEIRDPLTGEIRPVGGLKLAYASAVGAGGLTRILPNQWSMTGKLRDIPNSVEEFTGFYKGWDLLGGDFLGWGSSNNFEPEGSAIVRNVVLPSWYKHGKIPDTEHLLQNQAMVEWINNYKPSNDLVSEPKLDVNFETDSRNILWAADVWYSIKKHWVLELQRLIRSGKLKSSQ